MSLSKRELEEYVSKHGCYCGGDGEYRDFNCGADFMVTCPHCLGSGQKQCDCDSVSLRCKGRMA